MAAAARHRHFLYGFIALCLIKGVFSAIVEAPDNTLVVRCDDEYANMTCKSDRDDEIAWTYDGNTVINSPCRSNEPGVFEANSVDKKMCNIGALLEGARLDPNIQRISGPYGCTDRNNDGRTNTSMVVVLDAWCGVVNPCPIMENDTVTLGCFGHFDWLSFNLQYNPIVTINSTLHFVEKPDASDFKRPEVPPFTQRPPLATELISSYTIGPVKAGETISSTCRIDFTFSRAERAYSDRNKYSVYPLHWNCTINQKVNSCPVNVTIYPKNACQAGTILKCTSSSYPPATYKWIDHNKNDEVVSTEWTYTLPPGNYSLTCIANVTINCSEGNKVCRDPDSYWAREGRNATFPYHLFNSTAPDFNSSFWCSEKDYVSGFAVKCPNMTLHAHLHGQQGSFCAQSNEVVLAEPSAVEFHCIYEVDLPDLTKYSWTLDNQPLPYTSKVVDIHVPAGPHTVTCRGVIDLSHLDVKVLGSDEDCNCTEARTLHVSVIDCYNASISPRKYCVPENSALTCSADGYPPPASFSWKYWDSADTDVGHMKTLTGIKYHYLQCEAKYSHPNCTQHYDVCHVNITVRTFRCPNITMWATNGTNCTADDNAVYLMEPATVTFKCFYDNPPSDTTYTWSLDGKHDTQFTGNDAHFAITSGGNHTVTCKALINESADCQCDEERSIKVTVVECKDPTLDEKKCVRAGHVFTCTATSGYPTPPAYLMQYWSQAGYPATSGMVPTYTAINPGVFGLKCTLNYSYTECPAYAVCHANFTSRVYECPDNISLSHNISSYPKPSPLYNLPLSFNESTSISFECDFYTHPDGTTTYKWYVNDEHKKDGKTFDYRFSGGTHTVKCEASFKLEDCDDECKNASQVTIKVDEPSGCPFPHWPPVIPPIVAILLSLLMIPCYCYACGPWSGSYWAEERRKVIVEDQNFGQQQQPRPNTNTRQMIAVNGYGDGARLRPLTNGYGRL